MKMLNQIKMMMKEKNPTNSTKEMITAREIQCWLSNYISGYGVWLTVKLFICCVC